MKWNDGAVVYYTMTTIEAMKQDGAGHTGTHIYLFQDLLNKSRWNKILLCIFQFSLGLDPRPEK